MKLDENKIAPSILSMPLTSDELILIKVRYFDRIKELKRSYRSLMIQRILIAVGLYILLLGLLMLESAKEMIMQFQPLKVKQAAGVSVGLFCAIWFVGLIIAFVLRLDDIMSVTRRANAYKAKVGRYYAEGWKFVNNPSGVNLFIEALEKLEDSAADASEYLPQLLGEPVTNVFENEWVPTSSLPAMPAMPSMPAIPEIVVSGITQTIETARRRRSQALPAINQVLERLGRVDTLTVDDAHSARDDASTEIPELDTFSDIV